MKIKTKGKTEYRNKKGKLHRTDGPALITSDGRQEYHLNGKLHRNDGPAIIWPGGYQYYYQNGELHREDGPAVIRLSGWNEYWIEGKQLKKQQYQNKNDTSSVINVNQNNQ